MGVSPGISGSIMIQIKRPQAVSNWKDIRRIIE